MIEIRNVVKQYGDKRVLNDVSTIIDKGKITSFIGPNGAGKSTLLSIVSRLIPKNSGEVIIDGKTLENWPNNQLAKKLSILKQSNHLSIKLKIRELVSFGRFPYSNGYLTKEDEIYIDQALDYMQLKDIQDMYLDQLSGGQRQRAFIAMVLAQNTDYILLDEPLNNLDIKHSVEIMKMLRNLVDDLGKTIAIVIHDINFASCYSDHIVALKDGKIVDEGDIDRIIRKDLLGEIYDMEFSIADVNNMKLCVYY
ncbi:MAG: ATP-binding cassette domain-containing protein [Clostridiales bacterium]|jgi:iron complex transport system ATP-binding protein|nr:ATP-binding cassette domain-containing protein [Clostridiales bacterium]